MKKKVAYIHVHTRYSIKDGIGNAKDYANRMAEYNKASSKYEIVGMAISEHGK